MTAPQSTTLDAAACIAGVDQALVQADHHIADFFESEKRRATGRLAQSLEPVEALQAAYFSGGKRVRPRLVVLAALASGRSVTPQALSDVAVGIELLHACALVHDDIMDEAPQRRGAPSIHAQFRRQHASQQWRGDKQRFGESAAILVGDLALIYSDRFIGRHPELNDLWCQMRADLVLGQYIDVRSTAEAHFDLATARWLSKAKSGDYTITYPLLMGSALAGDRGREGLYRRYGHLVGEAFQLRDDLLSFCGDPELVRKHLQCDISQGRSSLLISMAVARDPEIAWLLGEAPVRQSEIINRMLRMNIVGQAAAHIDQLVRSAQVCIEESDLEPSWKSVLTTQALALANRDT